MSYFEKSVKILELPAILKLLSDKCESEAASKIAASIIPAVEDAEVERRKNETSAAVSIMDIKGAPSFYGIKDIFAPVQHAAMGGMLNNSELLDIAKVLQCTRLLYNFGRDDKLPKTMLGPLFSALRINRNLEDEIMTAIISEDEIADNASPELAAIRKSIRNESSNIRAALQKVISSQAYSKFLQDSIITMRSGRYVVPVKIEHKNDVPGLVHDVSASGMTVFVEPIAAVKANNQLKELEAREKNEIERILYMLSGHCAEAEQDLISNYNLLVRLDLIFAKAKLSYSMKGIEAERSEREINLRHARHPLLDSAKVVPTDIRIGKEFDTMIITGPNTGGKTVALKTLGLLAVMNQCGLHIPADSGSKLPVFSQILADIGDEQSIEQNLSTFSSHMTNIVSIMNECDDRSLVLFDELGAGTDPTEGAALAISIIEAIRKKNSLVAATTHYSELKVYALNESGVINASCEFNIETLRPTYRLLIGIPGKSNAFAISKKLGLSDNIITDAEGRIGTNAADFEATISKLDAIRVELENDRTEANKLLRTAQDNEKKSARLRAELEVRLEKADLKTKREAQRILEEARSTAEEVFKELDEMKKQKNTEDDYERINAERVELLKKLNKAAENQISDFSEDEDLVSSRKVKPGDVVMIKAMKLKAEVISADGEGNLQLRSGIINLSANEDDVLLLEDEQKHNKKSAAMHTELRTVSVQDSIDLRGMEATEAVFVAEQYLDNAVMGKLKTVTIIHGKGTGALRAAVQKMLKSNKLVKSYRIGRFGEGESGVTVVELK